MINDDELRSTCIDLAAALLEGEPGDFIAQALLFKELAQLEPDVLALA